MQIRHWRKRSLQKYVHSTARTYALNAPLTESEMRLMPHYLRLTFVDEWTLMALEEIAKEVLENGASQRQEGKAVDK